MGTNKPRAKKAQPTVKSFNRTQTVALETSVPTGEAAVKTVQEKVVCLAVHFGEFTNNLQVASNKVNVKAEAGWYAIYRRLVKSSELRAIFNGDLQMRQYIRNLGSPFENGVYMVPVTLVDRVQEKLRNYQERRRELVARFLEAYPELCKTARKPSGELYDESEYPSLDYVRGCFYFKWYYISFTSAGQLSKVSAELASEERVKFVQQMEEALKDTRVVLRELALSLLSNLKSKLEPAEDGKRRVLREATLRKLREFFEVFEFRNITDDTALAALVARAKDVINGVSVEALKTTETTREKVKAETTAICENLETMVVASRKFRFDEADAA